MSLPVNKVDVPGIYNPAPRYMTRSVVGMKRVTPNSASVSALNSLQKKHSKRRSRQPKAVGKRMATPNSTDMLALSSPSKRSKRRSRQPEVEKINILESSPEEILIHVTCFVKHSDLKQLLLVSKNVRAAALVAQERHFAFHTPESKPVFQRETYPFFEDGNDQSAPNAPIRPRKFSSRMGGKLFPGSIAVDLFKSNEDNTQQN